VATCTPRERSAREMAELMVGSSLAVPARGETVKGDLALEVSGLSLTSPIPFGTSLKELGFSLRKGEILGVAGVAGNGQDELLLALSGEMRAPAEAIRLNGRGIGRLGPAERRHAGLVAAPEDRYGHAAAPDMSLIENAWLTAAVRMGLAERGFIRRAKTRAFTEEVIRDYDVRTPGPDVAARALSGGNLQKFLMGRELKQGADVIVINQPTWGVDAAAASAIRQKILDCAGAGAAVLVISQDLDELMEIADTFAVLNEGRLSAPRPVQGLSTEEIGLMMGGAHGMEEAHHAR